ncbi:MAG: hypothetical protein M1824_002730, partial [Vezdaea acicularis]
MSASILQVPFEGFQIIKLAQSFSLRAYQALYDDRTEPVGIVAVIQAFGLVNPSAQTLDRFARELKNGTSQRKLQGTGIELVTGQSSTTKEMTKTQEGEVALMILSFLLHSLRIDTVTEIVKVTVNKTPEHLVPIKPRRSQIDSLVKAVDSQTSCVTWQETIREAEVSVGEMPLASARSNSPLPSWAFDVPAESLSEYFRGLCSICRFPDEYLCVLETSGSLSVPFALASSICGLRVCVIVDGEVVHGSSSAGQWQVRLERIKDRTWTAIKFGRKMENIQDLLVVDEVGPVRANKIPVKGIGRSTTVGQGMKEPEADDLAQCAIGIASKALNDMQREVLDYSEEDLDSVSYQSNSTSSKGSRTALTPVKTRVCARVVALWWDCSISHAAEMLAEGRGSVALQDDNLGWDHIKFPKRTLGNITSFESLDGTKKMQRYRQTCEPCSRDDYVRLLHTLTSQVLLLSFLEFNDRSENSIRVRNGSRPHNTVLGRAINGTRKPSSLGQTDVLRSWYYWIAGISPKELDRVDAYSMEGFLVYRNLLFDLSLAPCASETVIVEPGHILFEHRRSDLVVSADHGYAVIGHPQYRERKTGPCRIKSADKTGPVNLIYTVEEQENKLELTLQLKVGDSVTIDTSFHAVAMESWKLEYDDTILDCSHGSAPRTELISGETIEELTPGFGPELETGPPAWRSLKVFKSYNNSLGEVAALMSANGR